MARRARRRRLRDERLAHGWIGLRSALSRAAGAGNGERRALAAEVGGEVDAADEEREDGQTDGPRREPHGAGLDRRLTDIAQWLAAAAAGAPGTAYSTGRALV